MTWARPSAGTFLPPSRRGGARRIRQLERRNRSVADLVTLLKPLTPALQLEITMLWDEYEAAESPEARLVKALDKLETILQHNQGKNPPGFNYGFNLEYGRQYTSGHPVIEELRKMMDEETELKAES
jgi:putative hydrolase of HD superfamily